MGNLLFSAVGRSLLDARLITILCRQRRFKSIVEKAGFKLENGKQVTAGGPVTENVTSGASTTPRESIPNTPHTPKKSPKKVEPGSSTKRRKSNTGRVIQPEPEDDEEAAYGQENKLDSVGFDGANGNIV